MTTARIGRLLGPLGFLLVYFLLPAATLPDPARAVLATTVLMAIWWTTEAIPIAVTALVPIVLFPITGGMELAAATAPYGHRYVFLFLGGFLIAMAIEQCGLHKRMALGTIALIGSSPRKIILGAMAATALLSMWISNTATAVMMLPIATAIVHQLEDDPATPAVNEQSQFGKALMLAIAYSASIGGMATLLGTPVNLVLVGTVETVLNVEITFWEWFKIGFPVALLLLAICWFYLTRVAFSLPSVGAEQGARAQVQRLRRELGPMSPVEKRVLVVFVLTAVAWVTRTYLLNRFVPGLDDPVIAMLGGLALFLIPDGTGRGRPLLTWEEAVKLPWGIILLLGGGFALAAGFQASGLADWIGQSLTLPEGFALILVVLLAVTAVNFLTEITSNVATTSMLLPVLAAAAPSLGIHPYALLVPATLAATCAFMLPVATPPNAVVFGSGYLSIPDMVRAGFRMNLISIGVVTVFGYFVVPWVWGFVVG